MGAVGAHQLERERTGAEPLEIHYEEGQIGADVGLPQRGVELDAVHDRDRILEQHVLGPQVAVAIPDQPILRASEQCCAVPQQERIGEPLRGRHGGLNR